MKGFGPIIANSVVEWFQSSASTQLLAKLQEVEGIEWMRENVASPPEPTSPVLQGRGLAGKRVVVSGRWSKMTRKQAEQFILENGGEVSKTLNAKVDILAVGERPAESKLLKATDLGVAVVTEDMLHEICNASNDHD